MHRNLRDDVRHNQWCLRWLYEHRWRNPAKSLSIRWRSGTGSVGRDRGSRAFPELNAIAPRKSAARCTECMHIRALAALRTVPATTWKLAVADALAHVRHGEPRRNTTQHGTKPLTWTNICTNMMFEEKHWPVEIKLERRSHQATEARNHNTFKQS